MYKHIHPFYPKSRRAVRILDIRFWTHRVYINKTISIIGRNDNIKIIRWSRGFDLAQTVCRLCNLAIRYYYMRIPP